MEALTGLLIQLLLLVSSTGVAAATKPAEREHIPDQVFTPTYCSDTVNAVRQDLPTYNNARWFIVTDADSDAYTTALGLPPLAGARAYVVPAEKQYLVRFDCRGFTSSDTLPLTYLVLHEWAHTYQFALAISVTLAQESEADCLAVILLRNRGYNVQNDYGYYKCQTAEDLERARHLLAKDTT